MNKDKTPKIKKRRAKGSDVVEGLTCFKAHSDAKVGCQKTECRYWQKMKEALQLCHSGSRRRSYDIAGSW